MGLPKKGERVPGSGRKKGVQNKRNAELETKIQALGLDPLEGLAKILPTLDSKDQIPIYLGIMPYLYPKKTAIQLTPEDEAKLGHMRLMEKVPVDHLKFIVKKAMEEGKTEVDLDE